MRKVEQDKDEVLDWSFDYTPVIEGDTIFSSVWTLDPNSPQDLVVNNPSIAGEKTVIWLSGGTYGQFYKVTNHVVMTPSGREFDRTLQVRIVEK